ncbi:amidohydrolase family protein [Caproicibacterium sp. NSD3]
MVEQNFTEKISALEFLDFAVSFGRPPVPFTGVWMDKERLLKELRRNHIAQSAPYHVLAKAYEANYGNNLLMEEIGDDRPEMIPTWVVVPSEEAMGCSPKSYVDQMEKEGIKAVRLFPSSTGNPAKATRYAFTKWFYGDYFEEFQRRHIPITVEFSPNRRDEPDWPKLYEVAKDFPKLDIILADGFQRTAWTLIKLLRECQNLYVQTSGLDVHRELEYMVNQVGAQRFIAGSKFPVSTIGTMVGQVTFANLSFEEKKLIAGDNARRIMGLPIKGGDL